MRINAISVKNFKTLKNVKIENIPNMAVFLGMNGSGKTTLFDVFGFLHDCLEGNVRTALSKRGGFKEVKSREQIGAIEIDIKFRVEKDEPLITYVLQIDLNEKNEPVVKREILRFRRGSKGSPWHMLDFSNGSGFAIAGEPDNLQSIQTADRDEQKLDSPDILAIKGLGQFKKFKAVSTFRRFIEDWHVSDFHIEEARMTKDAGYSEQLNTTGDNLSLVARYMFENHRDVFEEILDKMSRRVPGVSQVEAKETEDGRIVLRFQDGKFIILHDKDSNDCIVLKQELEKLCAENGQPNTLIRIVCTELESWYLGDLQAVGKAFNMETLKEKQNSRKFRNPDSLGNPKQELMKIVKTFQQISGAREIAQHMDCETNCSYSFNVFIKGISKLIEETSMI